MFTFDSIDEWDIYMFSRIYLFIFILSVCQNPLEKDNSKKCDFYFYLVCS